MAASTPWTSSHADNLGTCDEPELTAAGTHGCTEGSPKASRCSRVGRTQDDENALAALQGADVARDPRFADHRPRDSWDPEGVTRAPRAECHPVLFACHPNRRLNRETRNRLKSPWRLSVIARSS